MNDPWPSILLIAAPLAAAAFLANLAWSAWRWGVAPMPTSRRVQRQVLQLIHAQGDNAACNLVDLGAGFGTMAQSLARALPNAHVHAIEGNRAIYGASRLFAALTRLITQQRPVHWRRADFMKTDFGAYQGVFCYLYPGAMHPLAHKLREELPAGAWVVSNTFALPGWNPETVLRADDWHRSPVYLYRVPEAPSAPRPDAGHSTP